MLEAIRPVTPEWIHEYMQPFHEGTERLNRAWTGLNTHSLDPAKRNLTLKARVISLLVGIALLVPFVNTIIWIAWRTFGHPENLSDPYCPEVNLPPPGAIVVEQPAPVPVAAAPPPPAAAIPADEGRPAELHAYSETIGEEAIRTNWKLEFFPDLIVVTQFCDEYSSTSLYNSDWTIKEYHLVKKNRYQFDIWLRESNLLETRLITNGVEVKKEIRLESDRPWVQQGAVGLKEFVKGNQTEFRFYGISPVDKFWYLLAPKPPFAAPFVAKKVGEEDVAGYGRLLKVEVMCEWRWPYKTPKGELWFEPQTGIIRKFINPNPFEDARGEYILVRPLPEPARP